MGITFARGWSVLGAHGAAELSAGALIDGKVLTYYCESNELGVFISVKTGTFLSRCCQSG